MSATFRSLNWVSGSYLIQNTLRLLQALIIAAWIGPSEMGLYALALTILTMIELIEKIGTDQLFITQSPNDDNEEIWLLNCWTMRVTMACVASVITFLATLLIEGDRVKSILLILAAVPPLMALKSAHIVYLQKHREFVPLAKFEIVASIFQSSIAIIAVYFQRNAESLVAANVFTITMACIASHIIFNRRHEFTLDFSILQELFSFGTKSAYISILTTLHNTLDNLAVAHSLGSTALGIYSTGYRLTLVPLGIIQSVASRILVSQYRYALNKSLESLVTVWQLAFRFLVLINATLMSVVIFLAEPVVSLLLGLAWDGAVPVIILASFTAFFRGAALSLGPLLMLRRQLHLDASMKTIEVAVFCAFIVIGLWQQSLSIFLVGGIVSYAIAFFLRVFWWQRHIECEGLAPPNFSNGVLVASILLMLVSYVATLLSPPLPWAAGLVLAVTAFPIISFGKALVREMDK